MKRKYYKILGLILLIASIGIFVYYKAFETRRIQPVYVISTVPKNNSLFIGTGAEVIFNLNRNLTQKDEEYTKIEISPDINTLKVFQDSKIRISPEDKFQTNTKYTITLYFNNKTIYTLVFNTLPISEEKYKEESDLQTQGDLDFTEAYKELLDKYPWYYKLPIQSKEYRIVYDFEKESFRIRLLIKPEDNNQKDEIIKDALEDIHNLGVQLPINNYYLVEAE